MKISTVTSIIVCTLFLSGCSSIPEPIESNSKNLVTSYHLAKTLNNNEEVRLGGVVKRVVVKNDVTQVEIINLPINDTGKPHIDAEANGRYLVLFDGFIDPISLSEGRLITVLGNMRQSIDGYIGEYKYEYPVIKASGYHLWRVEKIASTYGSSLSMRACRGMACGSISSIPTNIEIEERVK